MKIFSFSRLELSDATTFLKIVDRKVSMPWICKIYCGYLYVVYTLTKVEGYPTVTSADCNRKRTKPSSGCVYAFAVFHVEIHDQ